MFSTRRTDDPAALRRQLDDARYEAEQLREKMEAEREEHQREREERRRERYQEYAALQRQADDWPEALRKQISLLSAETKYEDPNDPTEDFFFSKSAAACERALQLWHKEAAEVAPQIEEVMRQVSALRDGIRFKVADTLEAEGITSDVVSALRDYDENSVSEWLDW